MLGCYSLDLYQELHYIDFSGYPQNRGDPHVIDHFDYKVGSLGFTPIWKGYVDSTNACRVLRAGLCRSGQGKGFRVGGGLSRPGLAQDKAQPQMNTWALAHAPEAWCAQDVLDSAGCKDVTILKLPGKKHRSWLVRAIVPEADHFGVVAIQECKCALGYAPLEPYQKQDGHS